MSISALAGAVNLGCLAGLAALWRREFRRQPAPAERPCPGPLSYATGKWGDTVGLTLIVSGVAWSWAARPQFPLWLALCPLFAAAVAAGYVLYCHRARLYDWTFQAGRFTRSGWLHQGYIFLGVTVAAVGLGRLADQGLSWPLAVAMAGGAVYLLSLLADLWAGRRRLFSPWRRGGLEGVAALRAS